MVCCTLGILSSGKVRTTKATGIVDRNHARGERHIRGDDGLVGSGLRLRAERVILQIIRIRATGCHQRHQQYHQQERVFHLIVKIMVDFGIKAISFFMTRQVADEKVTGRRQISDAEILDHFRAILPENNRHAHQGTASHDAGGDGKVNSSARAGDFLRYK